MRAAVILGALLLAGSASALDAQIPRARAGYDQTFKKSTNPRMLKEYLASASFARVITVDSGGAGDYADLSEALDFVATQPRGQFSRWQVLIYPGAAAASNVGQYDEASISIPSYTTLQGVFGAWGNGSAVVGSPVIHPTNTSGTLVTMGQSSSMVNVMIHVNALTAATVLVDAVCVSGNPCSLTNVALYLSAGADHDLDVLKLSSGSLTGTAVFVQRSTANTKTRGVVMAGGTSLTLYGGRIVTGSGSLAAVENLSASSINLYGVRIDSGATTDLKRSSTGTIVTRGTHYATESGTVDGGTLQADAVTLDATCKILTGAGTPEGAVTAGVCSIFLRTDGGAATTLYVKESGAGNTGWVAK